MNLKVLIITVIVTSVVNVSAASNADSAMALQNYLSSIGQLENCVTMASYVDPDLGTIDAAEDVYCSEAATFRIIPGITCCSPMTPEAMGVKFELFDAVTKRYTQLNWRNKTSPLDPLKPVHFMAHGWMETGYSSTYLYAQVEAMADRKYQSIAINWERANGVKNSHRLLLDFP